MYGRSCLDALASPARVLALLGALIGGCAPSAPAGDAYVVASGRYQVRLPEGWDGVRALPTTLYFHGHGGSSDGMMRNTAMNDAFSANGILVVYPDGDHDTWSHEGSPHAYRDEIAFVDEVLADVRERWPVDEERLVAAGFSQGASMAYYAVCARAEEYRALLPVSGGFWVPVPQTCSGPVNVRHEHGTSDSTFPLEGRPIGSARQGDVRESVDVLRAEDGCAAEPSRTEVDGVLSCEVWEDCTTGRETWLCLHDGGHTTIGGWVARAHGWAWERE